MSYIGNTPTTQNFIAGTDQFTGTGSQTNFTLSRFVNSSNDIEVVIANVVQNPTSYSISGNTLTISPAVGSGVAFYVRYLSTTLQSIAPQGGTVVNGDWGINGNLNFSGNARRITGDFSNATLANRVMFQSSTTNGNSSVAVLPNGTSLVSGLLAFNNSDPTNAAFVQMATTAGTEARFLSGITGTGTYLPMTFGTGGAERMRIDTSGNVGIGTSSPSSRLHISDSSGGGTGRIRMSCVVSSGYDSRIFQNDVGLNFSAVSDSRSLIFRTGNSDIERARIDGTGQQSSVIPGGSVLYPEFKCRAWVNFNGTGTVAIRASGNVSSITDGGVGVYTVNFTTAMPDANYSVAISADNISTNVNSANNIDAFGTAGFAWQHVEGGSNADTSLMCAAVFR